MLQYISEGFTAMIESGTDTEHFAAMYLTNLCEPKDFRGVEKHYPVTEMWKALKAAIRTVEDIQKKRKLKPENYLNVCASMCSASFDPQCMHSRSS
jgi:glutamine amidotransferase